MGGLYAEMIEFYNLLFKVFFFFFFCTTCDLLSEFVEGQRPKEPLGGAFDAVDRGKRKGPRDGAMMNACLLEHVACLSLAALQKSRTSKKRQQLVSNVGIFFSSKETISLLRQICTFDANNIYTVQTTNQNNITPHQIPQP